MKIRNIEIIHGLQYVDLHDDNVDIVIQLVDGRLLSGTVFTIQNVVSLMAKDRETGEALNGSYFYCPDMLIISEMTQEKIEQAVYHLIDEEQSLGHFSQIGHTYPIVGFARRILQHLTKIFYRF